MSSNYVDVDAVGMDLCTKPMNYVFFTVNATIGNLVDTAVPDNSYESSLSREI